MERDLHEKIGSVEFEKLFAGMQPPAIVKHGTIKRLGTAATLKRGTLLVKGSDGLLYVCGTNPTGEATEDFNGDGPATTFTLAASPLPAAINGAKVGTADATVSAYNPQTGVVTLSAAPAAGTKNVHITYEKAGVNEPDCVLTDDVDVGTSAEENVAIYVSGCFNEAALIMAEDHSLTEADRDTLRKKGILLGTVQEP